MEIKSDKLISVIMPIYKVELYLHECIDSIINQTYSNLEIILVDDGSPDNCGKICDEYAKQDDRIVVVHKSNGGLSDARNVGLNIAHGDYIVFIDSDDWMERSGIQILYELAQKYDADIVIGGVEKFEDSTKEIIWTTRKDNSGQTVVLSKEEAIKDFLINGCASWARLYKAGIHKEVFFPTGEINEDEAIVLSLLDRCKTIVKTNIVVYQYRFRQESITSTRWSRKKLAWYEHCKSNLRFTIDNYPELETYAEARYRSSILWALNNMSENPSNFDDLIPKFRKELQNIMKKENWDFRMDKKEKCRAYFLAYGFSLYSWIVRLYGKHYT